MLASFSIIPIGTGNELKDKVAEIIKIVDQSGVRYRLGPMETTIEGEEEIILPLIMKCHHKMRELAPRVLTSIVIDDHKGRKDRLEGKVNNVIEILKKIK